jgi:metal-responsive CopG/Arc/MetJ family transcriptional regulator
MSLKTAQLAIRIEPETIEEIDKLAAREHLKRSTWIAQLIKRELDKRRARAAAKQAA